MVYEFNFPLQIERGDDPSQLIEVQQSSFYYLHPFWACWAP